jgi:hypothetical protein
MSKKKKQPPTYGVDIEVNRGIMQRHVPTGTRRLWILRGRYHGALLGLAAGDALGTTLEFKSPGTFKPLPHYARMGRNLGTGVFIFDQRRCLTAAREYRHRLVEVSREMARIRHLISA